MAEQMRPASKQLAPDPAVHFDRFDPKRESGQGKTDFNSKATPTPRADAMPKTVDHAQAGDKQVTADEEATTAPKPDEAARKKDESLGWEKSKS